MRTVELFAGIGGFRLACDELGIQTVWANDMDPKASRVYRDKFGKSEHVEGDIELHLNDIPQFDLLTGGFPCQPFSTAGKKLGTAEVRGTLFEKIVEILDKHKPKYFVLENVKSLLSLNKGSYFATILGALSSLGYFIEWRVLNAVNFGLPQNRERVLITGHRNQTPQTYLCPKEDLSELTDKDLSHIAIVDNWIEIKNHTSKFAHWGMALGSRFCHAKINRFSQTLPGVTLQSILENDPDKVFYFTEDTKKRILNSVAVNRYFNGVEILYNQRGGARNGYSIFGTAGVAPTLTSSRSRHYERYKVGKEYRRLTNVEYARIQGFPDTHCEIESRNNQYILYGNAVPPPLVKWVIDRVTNGKYERF